MSKSHNIDVIEAPELHETTRSGRATWDERGNTVWEWQTAPGIYSRDVSTQQLQTLQATELRLVDQSPGVTSTYSHWKRQYQDRFTRTPVTETELVMPARRKDVQNKNGVFEQFLKHLGLPA
ncbi:MAG: hypothetical protein ABUL58_07370 [Steroidobacter sp.]